MSQRKPCRSEFWSTKSQRRGWLNLNSQATETSWGWEDFSESIEFLATEYANTMPLGWYTGEPGSGTSKQHIIAMLADWEKKYNDHLLLGFGSTDDLWAYLTWEGSVYLDRICRDIIPCAYLEARFDVGCEPYLVGGIAAHAYPIILPIVRERVAKGQVEGCG